MASLDRKYGQIDLPSRSSIMVVTAGMVLAQYMDTITTIVGVYKHGLHLEGNLFVHYTIQNYGFLGFISQKIFALMMVIGLTLVLFRLGYARSVVIILGGFTLFMGVISIHNLYLLYLLQ
ncbi:MAG: hypothetical protein SVK08_04030 [Halobacteriota archaeon]|nr:hypothetical protein [Halobacteriota archaeon]